METIPLISKETLQYLTLIAGIFTLFGWLLKKVITHFIKKSNEKDDWIKQLHAESMKNTVNFIEVINHQRTKDREALAKLTASIDISNKGTEALIGFLQKQNGNK